MGLQIVTRPTKAEILALLPTATLKANQRIIHSKEDALLEDAIVEAYDWLAGENGWLNRSVLTTSWKLTLPMFGKQVSRLSYGRPVYVWEQSSSIVLPRPPLVTVTSIKYLVDGVQTTLATDQYVVDTSGLHGVVHLADGEDWPDDVDTHPEAVEIIFSAGYGTGAEVAAAHPGIVRGLKTLAGDYFKHREDTFTDIRMVEIDRKVINGVTRSAGRYRIVNSHA